MKKMPDAVRFALGVVTQILLWLLVTAGFIALGSLISFAVTATLTISNIVFLTTFDLRRSFTVMQIVISLVLLLSQVVYTLRVMYVKDQIKQKKAEAEKLAAISANPLPPKK